MVEPISIPDHKWRNLYYCNQLILFTIFKLLYFFYKKYYKIFFKITCTDESFIIRPGTYNILIKYNYG